MLSLVIVKFLVWLVKLVDTAAVNTSPTAMAKFSVFCSKSSPTDNSSYTLYYYNDSTHTFSHISHTCFAALNETSLELVSKLSMVVVMF